MSGTKKKERINLRSRSGHLRCLFKHTWAETGPVLHVCHATRRIASWLGFQLKNNPASPWWAYDIRSPGAFYHGPQIHIPHVYHWTTNCLHDVWTHRQHSNNAISSQRIFKWTSCSILVQVLLTFPWIPWNSLESTNLLICQEKLCCVSQVVILYKPLTPLRSV